MTGVVRTLVNYILHKAKLANHSSLFTYGQETIIIKSRNLEIKF
jgi:hypothetical protein